MIKTRSALVVFALLMALPLAAQDATSEVPPLATVDPSATIDPLATVDPLATLEVTSDPLATMEATQDATATTEPGTAPTSNSTQNTTATAGPGPAATAESTQDAMADMSDKIVVGGLHAPRHIFIRGNDLYIAEAGTGGPNTVETEFGALTVGGTGQITRVRDGIATPFITNLFSSASETGEATGPHAFYLDEESAWVLVGQGIPNTTIDFPTFALVSYSTDGLIQGQVIDLYANETVNNPDGGEIDSNPVDFTVAPDGTVFVADAGANAVLRVGTDGVVSTFAVWPPVEGQPQAVPTSVELDADGNLYVGFLTGFPFPVGGAWIEVLDPNGDSLRRYDGLTMVTDIDLAADGTLYAVEFGQFTEQGPRFNSGRIVRVSESGVDPVVTGLNFPYGMEANADGSFYVTNNTSFAPEGQLLWVQPGDDFTPPASTQEPGTTGTQEPSTGTQASGATGTSQPGATGTQQPGGVATMEATMEATMDATIEPTMDATIDATMDATADVPVATAEATSAP